MVCSIYFDITIIMSLSALNALHVKKKQGVFEALCFMGCDTCTVHVCAHTRTHRQTVKCFVVYSTIYGENSMMDY